MRDFANNIPWKHLHIRRLPKNSTSVTQSLTAGVLSVFKRAFIEMLSQEPSIIRNLDMSKAIKNGHAWSLIPYAWNQLKASTIRNCFAHTNVLPKQMGEELRRRPTREQEQLELAEYSQRSQFKDRERACFEYLVAEKQAASHWTLEKVGDKDEQEVVDTRIASESPCSDG